MRWRVVVTHDLGFKRGNKSGWEIDRLYMRECQVRTAGFCLVHFWLEHTGSSDDIYMEAAVRPANPGVGAIAET